MNTLVISPLAAGAIIGILVGFLVANLLLSTVAASYKKTIGIISRIVVAIILGLLAWVIIMSFTTFSPRYAASPALAPAGYEACPSLSDSFCPASAVKPAGTCAANPVNPKDGEYVTLSQGDFVIEEYDNNAATPVHKFWSYNVASKGSIVVMAQPDQGTRAWECTDTESAYGIAMKSAEGYKSEHYSHEVFGPDAVEVH